MKRNVYRHLVIPSLVLFALLLTACQSKEERFVNRLMRQMTFEEKLGQLNLLPVLGEITTGATVGEYDLGDRIAKGEVGGLFNLKGVDNVRNAQRIAVEESRLGIPLLFGMDVIHGYETIFPIPLAQSCSWDTTAIRLAAQIAAKEATADGICWTFSPMVDICRDARWGRVAEGNGEDPYLGSAIAKMMVEGYQGADLADSTTMMACVKHFALYGGAEAGRDYNMVDMSAYRMANDYLPPYKAAVDAGCGSVMAAFNTLNGMPCHCNKWLLTDLLRKQWKFNGFVVSDYTGILELIEHRMGPDLETVGQRALSAGCDMDMVSEAITMNVGKHKWKENKKQVNEACRRVLMAKYRLGLFDDPYRYCDKERRATDIYTEANRAYARQLATETFVLLKNDSSATTNQPILPLSPTTKVALIGPLADTRSNMAGTWSVAATFDYKTVRESFAELLPQGHLFYAKGANVEYDQQLQQRGELFGRSIWDERTPDQMRAEAMAAARKADVIVLAMGETSEMSGESSSRTNLTMPKAQQDLIDDLATLNKPMVLLNFTGRPVVLLHESEVCDAILQVWFGGSETANAIADVVFGKVSPSGKLTTSFPRSVGQEPLGYRQYSTGRPSADGQFVKYLSCYLDESTLPLYPFGYGLSYTTFKYGECVVDDSQCSVTVTNTGKMAADEVVQLYVRAQYSTLARPIRELRGFKRIHLEPGESMEVSFAITDETLGYYNDKMQFVVEPGPYEFIVE
ncbi:MAG: beta-glucosidase BglX [Paludibacteraceae bacterium]|nr:beta-glucosidase BglX [Paludibacteraceae bacterium]